jgi:hypothetical protein
VAQATPGAAGVSDLVAQRRCAPGLREIVPRESRGEENAVTFPIYRGEIPYLPTGQMIEVDRAMMG